MENPESHKLFPRIDMLTGCNNLVSFSEALSDDFGNRSLAPLSMIEVDVHNLTEINRVKGRSFGDSLLRWFGFTIKDMTGAVTYRISGDDFLAVLVGDSHEAHVEKAGKMSKRLNLDAGQFGLEPPLARVTLFQFPEGVPLDAAIVWKYMNEKHNFSVDSDPFMVIKVNPFLNMKYDTAQALVLMANRITDLGYMLENTFGLAYTDPISGSPNMLAIQHKLDLALAEASQHRSPLSVCLLDGDDLRRYNSMDYAAGDDVIRKLNAVLTSSLRPNDFLGRWRMGDEFIVILPETNLNEAIRVGERLRLAVETASKTWLHPTTISVGVVCHPQHGTQTAALLERAEQALKTAKKLGKNRVVSAE